MQYSYLATMQLCSMVQVKNQPAKANKIQPAQAKITNNAS